MDFSCYIDNNNVTQSQRESKGTLSLLKGVNGIIVGVSLFLPLSLALLLQSDQPHSVT